MNNKKISNVRILKNTVFLYCRMFVIMAVSLYTSRMVLAVLGVQDYGIYDVAGSVVVLFSFLSAALNSATQRFLSVELGNNDLSRYNQVFNSSLRIYFFFAIFIVVLAETIGLWSFNHIMQFPSDRYDAANWVFQFSILTFALNIIRTPFNASIIANEKMSFYAYTSFFEVFLKLTIVLLLYVSADLDKLKFYAVLMSVVSFILLVWYSQFCVKTIPGCQITKIQDRNLAKSILSFSTWSLMGSAAVISTNQGVNILLNIFYGVTVNAGMGIANQVSQVINQFASNFQLAFTPQITKAYEPGNIGYQNLVFRTSRLSYYLLFLISLPILFNIEFLLDLWLKEVPDYAADFCFWIILSMLFESLSAPLYLVVQAEGRIRNYQVIVSLLFCLNIVLSFLFLSLNYQPIVVVVIRVVVSSLLLLFRVFYVSKKIAFKLRDYLTNVIVPIIGVTLISSIPPLIYTNMVPPKNISLLVRVISMGIIFLISSLITYRIGLMKGERIKLNHFLVNKFNLSIHKK